ncbi:PBS lyase HEAT domain protein repeat-containing protein, partial [Reticulomyxa filosa]
ICFDKDKNYPIIFYDERVFDRPLNEVMKLNLPNFQYVLHHPDIHVCIVDHIKIIQSQLNALNSWNIVKFLTQLLKFNPLLLLQCLCISTETSDIIVQCYKQVFKRRATICAGLLCDIAVKLNEQQLDDIIEFFMDRLGDKANYIHEECACSLSKVALHLNGRQLNKVFEFLMNAFESGKITICDKCAHALVMISLQLEGKQLDDAFQCLIHRFPSYFRNEKDILNDIDATRFIMKFKEKQLNDIFNKYNWAPEDVRKAITMTFSEKQFDNTFDCLIIRSNGVSITIYISLFPNLFEEIVQRLNEKQINIALDCFMDRLNDKKERKILVSKILNKCNEKQLDKAFNFSMDIFNDGNDNVDVRKECVELLGTIAVKLDRNYFSDAFHCLINGLKDSDYFVRVSCINLLMIFSKKWNEEQLAITFQCLMDGFKNINGYHCDISSGLLKEIVMQLNETQVNGLFTCLINGFKNFKCNHYLYARSIGHISMKLNKQQWDDALKCLNGLKYEDMYIRVLCEKSLETISTKLNDKQLEKVFNAFIHGLKDQNKNVRKSCVGSLGIIATKVNVKRSWKVFNALITGLNDEDDFIRMLCAGSLGAISTELDDRQLKRVVNALKDEESLYYFISYNRAFEGISTKSNEEQSNKFFNALMIVSKRLMKTIDIGNSILFVILLQRIAKRLNDSQLYSLVIYLLKRAKKRCTLHMQYTLSKISEDMWKRVTIERLKENMQAHVEATKEEYIWERLVSNKRDLREEMKLLAVGLMTFNPRIQLSCNDCNICFDTLNELIRYCNEQAIEWGFPIHQSKWIDDNNYNDIPYPYLDNQIEE